MRAAAKHSPRLAEIVGTTLGSLSLFQAEIAGGEAFSGMTISRLRRGRVGWPATIASFARAFHARIQQHYGAEINDPSPDATEAWLLREAGFVMVREGSADPTLARAVAEQIVTRMLAALEDGSLEAAVQRLLAGKDLA